MKEAVWNSYKIINNKRNTMNFMFKYDNVKLSKDEIKKDRLFDHIVTEIVRN